MICVLIKWQEYRRFFVPLHPIFSDIVDRMSDINALSNASIDDKNCSGLAFFAFPEAKSSKTGVSVRYGCLKDRQIGRWQKTVNKIENKES